MSGNILGAAFERYGLGGWSIRRLRLLGVTVLGAVWLSAPVTAQDSAAICDCGDVIFEASKNRIPITYGPAIASALAAKRAAERDRLILRRVLHRTDTVVQRLFNGDLDADHDPGGWEEHNGALVAMSFDEWQKYRSDRPRQFQAGILVCPSASLESVTTLDSQTVARYRLTQVGRVTALWESSKNRFEPTENGQPLMLDVKLNSQGELTSLEWQPQDWSFGQYTTARGLLLANLKRRPKTDFGETQAALNVDKSRWRERLLALDRAATVCR